MVACPLDRVCRWSGVLGGELAAVRCDLEDFAAEMFESFARAEQRRWGEVYLRGLLLDGGRKSVEPMAARLGEDGNRQALAHFVTTSPWDAAHVRARLAWWMQPVIKPTALVIDDTGFLKDGGASACVSRQYTGTAGKVTNCQAGVSLHLTSNDASIAVNWRLFLPESWDPAASKADPVKVARRTSCAVPAELGHVEKWQLALDMIDETRSCGVDVPRSSPTAADTVTPPPSGSAWRRADSTTWWASRPRPPRSLRRHGRAPPTTPAGADGRLRPIPSQPGG